MNSKMARSAPESELQRAVHCLKYAETSTLQLKNVYSFVLKLNDGLKSAIIGLRSAIRSLRKVEQERDYWKMRFESLQNRDDGGNWRMRYESLLERNEQLEEELRKLYSNEMAIEDFQSRMDSSPFLTGNGSNGGVGGGQHRNGDDEDEDEDESDFEDDSEGGCGGNGERNFPLMLEGPPMNGPCDSGAFNPASMLKIKCEVEEDDDDQDQEEEIEIKIKDFETQENGSTEVDYEALRNCLAKDARQCPVCPRICSQRNSTVRHLIEVHHLDRSELMIRKFHKGYHFANFSK